MPERMERDLGGTADVNSRFDSVSVRWILQRAAEEQHRLDSVLADSYSLSELEEMAAEAGISQPALRAAIEAARHRSASANASVLQADERRPSEPGWLKSRTLGLWSPAAMRLLLASTAAVAVFALLLSLPLISPLLFWATILSLGLVSLLVLLGASPF